VNGTEGNRRERGIALLLVIWMTALLSVVAMVAAGDARSDLQIASNLVQGAQARSLADGAVWWMISQLIDHDADTPRPADGTATQLSLDGEFIDIAVQDEGGKIDVNAGDAVILTNLCRVLGFGKEAGGIAENIVRYREQMRNGAPEARQPAFAVIEELRLVPGIDPDRYARIRPFVTVYTGDGHVNPRTAPREVIMSLPGVLPAQADAYLRERARQRPGSETGPLPLGLAGAAPYLSAAAPKVVTITAISRGAGQTRSIREAVVDLQATEERPFRLVAWRRGVT
jgi:general secretion pathway protein K